MPVVSSNIAKYFLSRDAQYILKISRKWIKIKAREIEIKFINSFFIL